MNKNKEENFKTKQGNGNMSESTTVIDMASSTQSTKEKNTCQSGAECRPGSGAVGMNRVGISVQTVSPHATSNPSEPSPMRIDGSNDRA